MKKSAEPGLSMLDFFEEDNAPHRFTRQTRPRLQPSAAGRMHSALYSHMQKY